MSDTLLNINFLGYNRRNYLMYFHIFKILTEDILKIYLQIGSTFLEGLRTFVNSKFGHQHDSLLHYYDMLL